MRTILVTGKPLPAHWAAKFEQLGFKIINGSTEALIGLGVAREDASREMSEDELARCLPGVEIYVYGGLEPASEKALENARDLKFISFLGTGWSDPGCVDGAAAARHEVRVSNTPHANALSVAEFALGIILGASRRLFAMSSATASGQWHPLRGSDVSGKVLGIVGLGAIGSRLARFARIGLGMEVLYFGPHPKTDMEELLGVKRVDTLESLFSRCDIISIHAPATSETAGLVDGRIFNATKDSIIVVNCAAPEIVDGHALQEAIESGVVKAAVFDGKYPDADLNNALVSLGPDRFVQFPRSAWLTDESYERMAEMSYASVAAYTRSSSIPFLVLG